EKQLEPDLVVMGTVSRGGAPRLILGNTAERLLSRLDTSLLVIKPASPSPATPGPR
ncbi:MAG: universal stress protein, partial [Deltaproteobacteria bacterium]|nr:universal stress protein [Deltaproteobacteria bacterium]